MARPADWVHRLPHPSRPGPFLTAVSGWAALPGDPDAHAGPPQGQSAPCRDGPGHVRGDDGGRGRAAAISVASLVGSE